MSSRKRPDVSIRNKKIFTGKSGWRKGKKFPLMSDEQRKKQSISAKKFGIGKWMTGKLKDEKLINWKGKVDSRTRWRHAPRPKSETCEVCDAFTGTGKAGIHLDHDHATGKFRGWLCGRCNVALGMVKDNTETLIALAEYIKKSRE